MGHLCNAKKAKKVDITQYKTNEWVYRKSHLVHGYKRYTRRVSTTTHFFDGRTSPEGPLTLSKL